MNKYIILTRILLKGGSDSFFKNKRRIKTVFLSILMIIAFLPTAAAIFMGVSGAYDLLKQINQQGVLLGFGLSISALMIFIFGIFFIVNIFYFSQDTEILLWLPLKPGHILGAKFTVTVLYEYLTELILLLPILIAYGIKDGGGLIYYIYGMIVFLILPVIPITLAALLNMTIMRFSSFAKNKDRFKIIGGMIGIFFAIAINMYIQKFNSVSNNPESIRGLLVSGNNSMLGFASKMFPTSKIAALSLISYNNISGIVNLIIFIMISFGFIALFILVGEILYFKGAMGISEAPSKRKGISENEFNRFNKKGSSIKSYTLKEIRILFRTPTYFMNCILMNFIWPVFVILPFIINKQSKESLSMIKQFIISGEKSGVILAASLGIALFITSTNCITSTAISREGKNLFITKYIPMDSKNQLISKVIPGIIMGLVGILVMLIPLIIIIRLDFSIILSIIFVSTLGIVFSSIVGILIDLNFPKLNWDSEQKAVKQNFNVIICMIICLAVAGLTLFAVMKFKFSLIITLTLIGIVFGVVNYILYKVLCKWGVKIFEAIE